MYTIAKKTVALLAGCLPLLLPAQKITVLTNHIGYETTAPKNAVVEADRLIKLPAFQVVNTADGQTVYSGKPVYSGAVSQWKNWQFWTLDFSALRTKGAYRLVVNTADGNTVQSYPFVVEDNLLEQHTVSDVVYYFKGQRSSGLLDKADRALPFSGKPGTADVHGGWYDATGDYGKHLSHLSFSNYFNPQQISLTDWGLFKVYELLAKRNNPSFRQYLRRILDEALYGADYLVRVQVPGGSFYRSVNAPGPGKLPADRRISTEGNGFIIKKSSDQTLQADSFRQHEAAAYQVSFRSGGGVAIAALAKASGFPVSGEYTAADYLKAAEKAFAFLEKNNPAMCTDGKENILDDYCALLAATELYKATGKEMYRSYAEKRAAQLMARLASWKNYRDYWQAGNGDRPFFHPADAGLPVVSLLAYAEVAGDAMQEKILATVKRSLQHELQITKEVGNPFGYSRQLVQDTTGSRYSAFFFPHTAETAPWWQGENARLASMAAAARMALPYFKTDTVFSHQLQTFAWDQLNWILGLNP